MRLQMVNLTDACFWSFCAFLNSGIYCLMFSTTSDLASRSMQGGRGRNEARKHIAAILMVRAVAQPVPVRRTCSQVRLRMRLHTVHGISLRRSE